MNTTTAIHDDIIIERILSGDTEAFALLVRKHQSMVFNYICRMLNEHTDAEDLAQETFIRAYQHLGTFDPARQIPFSAWLIHIARNLCFNDLKKKKTRRRLFQHTEIESEHEEDSEQIIHRKRLSTHLQYALTKVTPDLRETFILKEISGFPVTTIAHIQNIAVGTVKSRLSRLREKLSSERSKYDV